MERELYLQCYTGADCQKLLGAMLALGTDREGLEKRLSALVQCPVQILAQKEENRIPEVLVQTVRAENPVFEQAEIWKHITQSTATEKTKTRLFELFSYSRRVLKKEAEFIKGAAVLLALEELGFENFIVSSVTETVGSSEKGPLPGSYLLELIENYQIPMHFVSGKAEKSSPLGMLVLALCKKEGDFPPSACIEKAGVGSTLGKTAAAEKEGLRAMILHSPGEKKELLKPESTLNPGERQDTVSVLETNVDDCSGEQLGYAIECLMRAGALDASCFPISMKKHRPAYMLQVICKEDRQETLEDIIFRETTSIGLRRYKENRRILPRTIEEVALKDGHKVRIKVCLHHGQRFCYPEYETVRQICEETGRAFRDVYDEASAVAGGYYEDI